ncbi:MAG TPA: tetratricopeptide repeat protein [Pyrinomonadaceae bacterium]|jgi:tetratricopeptide (TPR) repeat protein
MKLSIYWRIAACAIFLFGCGAISAHAQILQTGNPNIGPRPDFQQPRGNGQDLQGTLPSLRSSGTNIIGRYPITSSMAVKAGNQSFKMNDYRNAYTWYSYALKLDAKESQAHLGLGAVYTALNHYDEAVKSYEQALALKPKMVEAQVGLGRAYFRGQLFEKAIGSFEQALVLKPKSVEAYLGIGDCYFTQKKYAEAVSNYQKIMAFNAKSVEAHYSLGVTYLLMKDRAAAIEQGRILKSLNKETGAKFDNLLKQFDAQP